MIYRSTNKNHSAKNSFSSNHLGICNLVWYIKIICLTNDLLIDMDMPKLLTSASPRGEHPYHVYSKRSNLLKLWIEKLDLRTTTIYYYYITWKEYWYFFFEKRKNILIIGVQGYFVSFYILKLCSSDYKNKVCIKHG